MYYKRQPNWINTSSFHLYSDLYPSSDGRYSSSPPFYTIGIYPEHMNCPIYNYTLPDTYPVVESPPTVNQMYYWYYPYQESDWNDYSQNKSLTVLHKPS